MSQKLESEVEWDNNGTCRWSRPQRPKLIRKDFLLDHKKNGSTQRVDMSGPRLSQESAFRPLGWALPNRRRLPLSQASCRFRGLEALLRVARREISCSFHSRNICSALSSRTSSQTGGTMRIPRKLDEVV